MDGAADGAQGVLDEHGSVGEERVPDKNGVPDGYDALDGKVVFDA